LSENEFKVASSRGLVRPDVYRSEILSLVRELRAPAGCSRREVLAHERQDLLKELRRIRERLTEIEREIGPVEDGRLLIEGHARVIDAFRT
jgi:hypothetical protein